MRITFLGTGHATVTRCYNTCFLLKDAGFSLLVDGGGGSTLLSRLQSTGTKVSDLHDIFVTHRHIDHILGIVWLLRLLCHEKAKGTAQGEYRIYGHKEVTDLLALLAEKLLEPKEARHIGESIRLIRVEDGEERRIGNRDAVFFDVGSLKARQFGFSLNYADGKTLACLGDEPCHPCAEPYVKGCTWLLHEAFCLEQDAALFHPYEKQHSTVRDACLLAERLSIPNLILYHTEDSDLARRKERYLAEGRRFYSGRLFVPDDLEAIDLD